MIVFLCPTCGKELKVKTDFAGKHGKCPHCKGRVVAPHQSGTEGSDTIAGNCASEPASAHASLTAFLDPARGPDELGRLGKYRVLSVLGSGGMGVVFAGEDTSLKRPVALAQTEQIPELHPRANFSAQNLSRPALRLTMKRGQRSTTPDELTAEIEELLKKIH